jgi:hypothetical protein
MAAPPQAVKCRDVGTTVKEQHLIDTSSTNKRPWG